MPAAAKGTAAGDSSAGQRPQKRTATNVEWSGITANGKPKAQGKSVASVVNQRSNFVRTNMKASSHYSWVSNRHACFEARCSQRPSSDANAQGGGRFSFKSKAGRGSQKRRGGRFGGRGGR